MMATRPHPVPSVFAAVTAWWRNRNAAGTCTSKAEDSEGAEPAQSVIPPNPDDHATLMVRRMARLGLEPEEFLRAEPSLFKDLRAVCSLCPCPERCALALLRESTDPAWQDWRNYCPNATTLSMLSTLRQCSSDDADEA